MNEFNYTTYVFCLISLVVILILAIPLILIWALNTLFPTLTIPYTFWTWLAVLIIVGVTKRFTIINRSD